jgi:hypothetical protein
LNQRIIYIGHRADQFEPFLKKHFPKVQSVALGDFQPSMADNFDVVLLDWPQTGFGKFDDRSPLGDRATWHKPTVLLGSAGLNLAVVWKLKGGSGCTCLAPVAYRLREHEIFKGPVPIDIRAVTTIPTPKAFTGFLKTSTVEVIPLIDNIQNYDRVIEDYARGWSTHYFEFADMPEVEIFCGGINEQTPESSAFWRQGNLLHFGFEQSPTQLNRIGRAMLLNGIAYISRFTEDRPIDVTLSPFGKEQVGISRRRARGCLNNHMDRVTRAISASTLAMFNWHDQAVGIAWMKTNSVWLHPNSENLLEIDTEARSLGVHFDDPGFLPATIAVLHNEKNKTVAMRLLCRYAPEGPGANADVASWEAWWHENSPYLFYSELGCYQWYIDPLAKNRKVPTASLRGPARADRVWQCPPT